ncbi:hypothetical protein FB451DRAFT_1386767 [Mycena latifolia]|nr:hypothetical protein FB451DRAFT_1386767 [Mycena latifolia]
MHSSIHSLAHRAPPATRTRVRWQPYNALASSISSRSPSFTYLSTPATSVSSPPPPKATPLCETERLKAHPSMPQTPRDPSNPIRENPKNKYATGLVGMSPPPSCSPQLPNPVSADQAVKSLCEIWRPQDIPTVFLTSSRANVGSCNEPPPPKSRRRNTQLPSPVSPLTQPSPPSPLSSSSPACSRAGQTPLQCEPDRNLVPIKGFVHEVLRRSRTSGSVLQTALCYLEAVRPKVPELIRKEQSGEGTFTEPDAESRVMPATPAELELEAQLSSMNVDFAAGNFGSDEDVMDTVRVYDEDIACTATPSSTSSGSEDQTMLNKQKAGTPLSSLAPLPSPLLCPRRAFLASLILASKFTQDKCYSNRAWAKLSGLPAREIGRCERALGDALDWRLWVGKTPVVSQAASSTTPTPAPVTTGRPVVRCQSESTLAIGKGSFLVQTDKKESTTTFSSAAASSSPRTRPALRGLRRCSTLPAEAFAKSNSYPATTSASESTWNGEGHQLSFSNIAQQDQLMGSPEFRQADSPSTPSSTYSSQQYPSPIPSTPSLTYSPSSTESSSGDRTIQMSSFTDDNMSALSHDVVIASCGEASSHWGASHSSPMLSGIAFEAALGPDHGYPTSAFLGVPPVKFGPSAHSATAWPWSDPTDDYSPAPLEYGLGPAKAAPGFPAKLAGMPALQAGPIVTRHGGISVGVFPIERDLDRPYATHRS